MQKEKKKKCLKNTREHTGMPGSLFWTVFNKHKDTEICFLDPFPRSTIPVKRGLWY